LSDFTLKTKFSRGSAQFIETGKFKIGKIEIEAIIESAKKKLIVANGYLFCTETCYSWTNNIFNISKPTTVTIS